MKTKETHRINKEYQCLVTGRKNMVNKVEVAEYTVDYENNLLTIIITAKPDSIAKDQAIIKLIDEIRTNVKAGH